MPSSKSRHPHKHPQQHPKNAGVESKQKDDNRIIVIAVIFFMVIGLSIGFFIDSGSIAVLLGCTAAGAVAGFFAGREFKKSLSGK